MIKKFITTFLILVFLTSFTPAYAKRWASKPPVGSQIDWGHPLAKGLVGCWLFNEEGGKIIEDISGNDNDGAMVNAVWSGGKSGTGLYFDTSTDYVNLLITKKVLSGSRWSVVARTYYTNVSGNIYANDTDYEFCVGFLNAAMNPVIVYRGATVLTSVLTTTTKQWIFSAFTCRKSGQKFYIGDNLGFRMDSSKTYPYDTGIASNVATRINSGNLYLPGGTYKIDYLYVYKRELSFQETNQLYEDPYCFIKQSNFGNFKGGMMISVDDSQVFIIN